MTAWLVALALVANPCPQPADEACAAVPTADLVLLPQCRAQVRDCERGREIDAADADRRLGLCRGEHAAEVERSAALVAQLQDALDHQPPPPAPRAWWDQPGYTFAAGVVVALGVVALVR